jgi:predicted nucleic acid-binding protein
MIAADPTTVVAMSLMGRPDLIRRLVGKVTVGDTTAREIEAMVRAFDSGAEPPGEEVLEVIYLDLTAPAFSRSESEAVHLAREKDATFVLTDDAVVREECRSIGVRSIGTLGLLFAARAKGLLDDLEEPLRRLREIGYAIAPHCEKALLKAANS